MYKRQVVDIIEDAIGQISTRDAVDFDSAEFELDWNNHVSLTDISLDTNLIYNEIREQLEVAIDIIDEDEEEAIEAQIEAEQPASEE